MNNVYNFSWRPPDIRFREKRPLLANRRGSFSRWSFIYWNVLSNTNRRYIFSTYIPNSLYEGWRRSLSSLIHPVRNLIINSNPLLLYFLAISLASYVFGCSENGLYVPNDPDVPHVKELYVCTFQYIFGPVRWLTKVHQAWEGCDWCVQLQPGWALETYSFIILQTNKKPT